MLCFGLCFWIKGLDPSVRIAYADPAGLPYSMGFNTDVVVKVEEFFLRPE